MNKPANPPELLAACKELAKVTEWMERLFEWQPGSEIVKERMESALDAAWAAIRKAEGAE